MIILILCILSAWLGAGVGFFACALCVAAKRADTVSEWRRNVAAYHEALDKENVP